MWAGGTFIPKAPAEKDSNHQCEEINYEQGRQDGIDKAIEVVKSVWVEKPHREGEEDIYEIKKAIVGDLAHKLVAALAALKDTKELKK